MVLVRFDDGNIRERRPFDRTQEDTSGRWNHGGLFGDKYPPKNVLTEPVAECGTSGWTCDLAEWVSDCQGSDGNQRIRRASFHLTVETASSAHLIYVHLSQAMDPTTMLNEIPELNKLRIVVRNRDHPSYVYEARKWLNDNGREGNRQKVPNILVWLAMYHPSVSDPNGDLLKDVRESGKIDTVIGRKSYKKQSNPVKMFTMVYPDKLLKPIRESTIARHIVDIMKLCVEKKSVCYWPYKERDTCVMDIRYAVNFCKDADRSVDCEKGAAYCKTECENGPKLVEPCTAPCVGTAKQWFHFNDSSNFYQYCESGTQTCTGPPCPTVKTSPTTTKKGHTTTATTRTTTISKPKTTTITTTPTAAPGKMNQTTAMSSGTPSQTPSTKKPVLKKWHIILIAVCVLALLEIIVAGLIVFCVRKRRRRKGGHGHRRHTPPSPHRHRLPAPAHRPSPAPSDRHRHRPSSTSGRQTRGGPPTRTAASTSRGPTTGRTRYPSPSTSRPGSRPRYWNPKSK